jgi:hypothetical protein
MLNQLIKKVKSAQVDLNCLWNRGAFMTSEQYRDCSEHLDAARAILAGAVKPKRMPLTMNGSDNPSCPVCGHYNAMLAESREELGTYKSVCRDCGAIVIGERKSVIVMPDVPFDRAEESRLAAEADYYEGVIKGDA